MGINPASLINSYFGAGNSMLSEETRRRLIALGIDPSTVNSEAQAQIIIQNVLRAKKMEAENIPSKLENIQPRCCAGEMELMKKAKELAQKMGLQLANNLTLDEILKAIAAQISNVLNSDTTDKAKRDLYEEYNQELVAIDESYAVVKNNENAIILSMNMNANINKMILGL